MDQDSLIVVGVVSLWLLTLGNIMFTIGLARRIAGMPNTSRSAPTSGLAPGADAPEFTLMGVGTGRYITLSTFEGQRCLLVFLGYQCSSCVSLIPELNRLLHGIFQTDGVDAAVIGIGPESEIRSGYFGDLIDEVFVDGSEGLNVSKDFRVVGTPSYCLIAPNGEVQAAGIAASVDSGWAGILRQWPARD